MASKSFTVSAPAKGSVHLWLPPFSHLIGILLPCPRKMLELIRKYRQGEVGPACY
jgi:hypothetical protein